MTVPTMLGANLGAASEIIGRPISLVLGAPLFRDFALAFSPRNREFQFVRSGSISIPSQILPLLDDRPRIAVEVNGSPAIVTIDLGSDAVISLSSKAAARLNVDGKDCNSATVRVADGTALSAKQCRVAEANIGATRLRDVPIIISDHVDEADGDGLVGMGFFNRMNMVIIDVGTRRLQFIEPLSPANTR